MAVQLRLARSWSSTLGRLLYGAGAILAALLFYGGLVVVSLLTWSEPPPLSLLGWLLAPCAVLGAWCVRMAAARGIVEVHADELVVRHPRVLRRPLRLHRSAVAAVLLDDGLMSGNARFPSGDQREPYLWCGRNPARQDRRRPLIGDGEIPNVALRLDPPLVLRGARDGLTAVPADGDPAPPSRRIPADVIFLAFEDTSAVRAALRSWALQDALDQPAPPPAVREPARPDGMLVGVFAATAAMTTLLMLAGLMWVAPLWIVAVVPLLARAATRMRRRTEDAIAAAGDDPLALAALRANFGEHAGDPSHRITAPWRSRDRDDP